jgi:predicted RNase H-like HicB family nuclease
VLHRTDEGISVSVPALPGCWSEGDTEEEAMENIEDAIRVYLAALEDRTRNEDVREVDVAVYRGRVAGRQPSGRGACPGAGRVRVIRRGKHIIMSDGTRQVTVPRHSPIKAFTMGGIVRDAGLTIEEFRKLL